MGAEGFSTHRSKTVRGPQDLDPTLAESAGSLPRILPLGIQYNTIRNLGMHTYPTTQPIHDEVQCGLDIRKEPFMMTQIFS